MSTSEDAVVRFRRLPLNPDLPLPARATAYAAGYDVRAAAPVELAPGQIVLVPTGLVMELPEGIECQVRPRSGLALKHGLTLPNSPGTIDPDYRGELKVILQNLGAEPLRLERGERIAQLVFARFEAPRVEEAANLASSGRGGGRLREHRAGLKRNAFSCRNGRRRRSRAPPAITPTPCGSVPCRGSGVRLASVVPGAAASGPRSRSDRNGICCQAGCPEDG